MTLERERLGVRISDFSHWFYGEVHVIDRYNFFTTVRNFTKAGFGEYNFC